MNDHSAYQWVLSRAACATPFGRTLLREPNWYSPGQEEELNAEFDRVETVLGWEQPDVLIHALSMLRDIRNSFRRQSNVPMDLVELFEVKHFLLHLARVRELYRNTLRDVELTDMEDMLDLLDPGGRRLGPFSLEDAFDPALGRIRAQKAAAETEEERRELARMERELELSVRRRLTAALLRERDRFLHNMEALGRLDLLLAKAALARKYRCTRPAVSEGHILTEDMIHPQVQAVLAEKGIPFTPVSALLERGCAVVTGANMGGKSVFLNSLVTNLKLMHTGWFVFADQMCSPLFHAVDIIGGDDQSVERGLSSFGAEMKALDEVLRRERGRFFFLALDEFARGTNPTEGASLARALVEYLNGLNCVAVMSTHYDGVSDAAARHYRVAGLPDGARGTLEDLPRLMDYSLVLALPGEPCPRDAAAVCRMLGLDQDLTALFTKYH